MELRAVWLFFFLFSFSVLRPWYNSLYKGQMLLPYNSGIQGGKWAYEIASESDLLIYSCKANF